MAGNPVAWFEIYVQDMTRARAFYEAVLQVSMTPLGEHGAGPFQMWAFPSDMTAYGTSGALVMMKGVPSGGNSTLVYFHCQDCAVEESRAAAAGGKVFRPKMAIGEHGFISLVTDPDGNMIGLHSMP